MIPTFKIPYLVYVILQNHIPVAVTHQEQMVGQLLRDYSTAPTKDKPGIKAEVVTYERAV